MSQITVIKSATDENLFSILIGNEVFMKIDAENEDLALASAKRCLARANWKPGISLKQLMRDSMLRCHQSTLRRA